MKGSGPKTPQLNIDIMKIWNSVEEYIPSILKDPFRLINQTLRFANDAFMYTVSYIAWCFS
jgi:hypothetical protein